MTDIKLNHLAIVVDDMDAALRFWRESLGTGAGGAKSNPSPPKRSTSPFCRSAMPISS